MQSARHVGCADYKEMKSLALSIFLLPVFLLHLSCSVDIHDCIPEYLSIDEKAPLTDKYEGDSALKIFTEDQKLRALISDFKPVEISAGSYEYYGITIRLGIARFVNADEAYGVYSGLTAMPRKRWEKNGGEISYKNPYTAGFKGVYAFWFYSPTHPGNYFEFYETAGEQLLNDLWINRRVKINSCSYLYRLLPEQNRYRESVVYIKSEKAVGLTIENAYTAAYQSGRNKAAIYIEGFETEGGAKEKFNEHALALKNAGLNTKQFPAVFAGSPGHAVYARLKYGYAVVYQYRWLIFVIDNADSLNSAEKFIRNIYLNMQDMKSEIVVK